MIERRGGSGGERSDRGLAANADHIHHSTVRRVLSACFPGNRRQRSLWLRRGHALLTVAWLAMVPVALMTGWIESLVFISACSIYANAVGHFSAWQAGRAEQSADESGS